MNWNPNKIRPCRANGSAILLTLFIAALIQSRFRNRTKSYFTTSWLARALRCLTNDMWCHILKIASRGGVYGDECQIYLIPSYQLMIRLATFTGLCKRIVSMFESHAFLWPSILIRPCISVKTQNFLPEFTQLLSLSFAQPW